MFAINPVLRTICRRFRIFTTLPWQHSSIDMHRVEQLVDVPSSPLRGSTSIVRWRKEEPGCWSDVAGFPRTSLIELLGASRWGWSNNFTHRNKTNTGKNGFLKAEVIRKNFGAVCHQFFDRRKPGCRIATSSVLIDSLTLFRRSSIGFVPRQHPLPTNFLGTELFFRIAEFPIAGCGCRRSSHQLARFQVLWAGSCSHLHKLFSFIVKLFNTSLTSGTFSSSQKQASVTPALKKSTLDPFDLGNYRPISNLTYVSKLLERVAHEQIIGYALNNQSSPSRQPVGISKAQVYWDGNTQGFIRCLPGCRHGQDNFARNAWSQCCFRYRRPPDPPQSFATFVWYYGNSSPMDIFVPTLPDKLNLYGSTAQLLELQPLLPAFRRDRSLDLSFSSCTLQMWFASSRRTVSMFTPTLTTSRSTIIQFSQVRPSCYDECVECLLASRMLQSGCLRTASVSTHQRQNWSGLVLPEDSSIAIWMRKWFYREPLFDRLIASGTSACSLTMALH